MRIDDTPNIANAPLSVIGVLARSAIGSAHDRIRGPAFAVLKSNGIKNPRGDIAVMEYHGSSPPARGDTEHSIMDMTIMVRRRTTSVPYGCSDGAIYSNMNQPSKFEVYPGSSPPNGIIAQGLCTIKAFIIKQRFRMVL